MGKQLRPAQSAVDKAQKRVEQATAQVAPTLSSLHAQGLLPDPVLMQAQLSDFMRHWGRLSVSAEC